MVRIVSLALLALMATTFMVQARSGNGRAWRAHGNQGYDTGENNFFLQPENQPQNWDCGPGIFPSQRCIRRVR